MLVKTSETVSVVIPCYNAALYLRDAIDSALNQTHPALDIIVIDDGSSDESALIADSYGPPVRVVRQANQGPSAARNRGIDIGEGQWIALLDADDVWRPNKLRRLFDAMQEAKVPNVVCVYSDFFVFGEQEDPHVRRPEYHASPDYRVKMLLDWSIPTITAMFLTEAAREVRFPEDMRDFEDPIFFLLLRERGRFLRVPEPLAGYRKHGRSQTSSADNRWLGVLNRYNWFSQHCSLYSDTERCLLLARLADLTQTIHDEAWRRCDVGRVRQARTLYRKIVPFGEYPRSLGRPLLLCRLGYWKKRLRMTAGNLRRGVLSAARRCWT